MPHPMLAPSTAWGDMLRATTGQVRMWRQGVSVGVGADIQGPHRLCYSCTDSRLSLQLAVCLGGGRHQEHMGA